MQPFFGNINTDSANLTGLRDSGAKVISYHGLADQLITPVGSANYFTRVADVMGGYAEVQKFNRLFMVPGMGHCAGVGTVSPTGGPVANASSVPLPASNQFFDALVAWVENGTAPSQFVLSSSDGSVTMPVCSYPRTAVYMGSGPATSAASYSCQ